MVAQHVSIYLHLYEFQGIILLIYSVSVQFSVLLHIAKGQSYDDAFSAVSSASRKCSGHVP